MPLAFNHKDHEALALKHSITKYEAFNHEDHKALALKHESRSIEALNHEISIESRGIKH
jgi:hypothetical protein